MLWTAEDAAAATGGRVSGDWSGVTGLSIDTREMSAGEMFVALEGENRDGHVFVAQALAAGAGAALVSHVPGDVGADAPLLIVDDTLEALVALGRAARARTGARVIAVTGSVGKTSTKDMMRVMLEAQGRTHAAIRSFNNHWGVPLTLARMPPDTEWAVIEIGMNAPGEITPLTKMARPHVALITTVAAVHLAAFDSVDGIADAKAEIFCGLEEGGTAVINRDIDTFARLERQAAPHRVITFGEGEADYRLTRAEVAGPVTEVAMTAPGREMSFRLGAPGAHMALNAVGAIAALDAAGADVGAGAAALADWTPPDGRGKRVVIEMADGPILLLDESYNANPTSVAAALGVLAATGAERARRHAFLGDMLELGPDEKRFHAGLAGLAAIGGIGKVHCCGPLMAEMHGALPEEVRGVLAPDSAVLAEAVQSILAPGDVVMVKGSLGARMARVVDAIRALGKTRPATAEDY